MESYGRLLGVPQVRVGETWYDLPQTKASALLVYLAHAGDWVSRDELLYVFYPDSPEAPARGSFRQLLTAVRKLPYSEGLESEDSRLRWQIETDIAAFKQALAQEKWAKALELYQGELLHGFQPHNLSEFDNWLSLERQTLHTAWRKASLQFADELATTERNSLAAEVLADVYKTDVLDEEVLRAYLETLYVSGEKTQALETFMTFKATLHHELSSEPEASTLELFTLIQSDKPLNTGGSVAVKTRVQETKPRHNLPAQPTEFVGRETEKAKLAELLAEPRCRLLTVVAPGGMGKTRLALEVARIQIDHFEQGVWFASFVAVNAPEQMVYTIADALDVSFFGQREPKEQLFDYLAEKEILLVVDNLEHLLSGVGLIRELLEAAPKIKILATSRERLNLQAEHIFDLGGLAVPDEGVIDAKDFDSLQLFTQSAKHSRHEFVLDENTTPSAIHICKLVEGMPLAIELAASWLRVLSITDIAREIEKGIDLLESSARDLPSRHHSIRAVFDHSWKLLTETEKISLRRLSVFQGGFRREAALEVAEVSLPILASLVDKSFLTLTPAGRYRRHPLVIQYTQEKLAQHPGEKTQTEEKHGSYYLQFLRGKGKQLGSLRRKETLEAVNEELTNVRAALGWAIKAVRAEELRWSAFYLYSVYRILRPQEGLEVSSQVVASLDETDPAHHAALGRWLVQYGTVQSDFGQHEEGSKAIRRGLDLLYSIRDVEGILYGLGSLQQSAWELGDYTESKRLCDEGLALARQYDNPDFTGAFLVMLSNVIKDLESMTQQEKFAFYEAGLKEVKALGDLYDLVGFVHHYAFFLLHHGQPQEAKRLQQDNLCIAREHSMVYEPGILDSLGMAEYKLGNHQGAYALLQQAYTVGEKLKLAFFDGYVFGNLGKVARALGDYSQAQDYLKRSLKIGLETKSAFNMATTLASFAELRMDQGQTVEAAELLSLSLHHPGTESHGRIEARRLLEVLANQLPAEELEAAVERGKSLDLTKVVQVILAEL